MKHDRQHRSLRWLLPLAAMCLLAAGCEPEPQPEPQPEPEIDYSNAQWWEYRENRYPDCYVKLCISWEENHFRSYVSFPAGTTYFIDSFDVEFTMVGDTMRYLTNISTHPSYVFPGWLVEFPTDSTMHWAFLGYQIGINPRRENYLFNLIEN